MEKETSNRIKETFKVVKCCLKTKETYVYPLWRTRLHSC